MQAELLLQNRFKKVGQGFISLSSRKDAKGEVATKKCRSRNSCRGTGLFLKDLSSTTAKQKLSSVPLNGISVFKLKMLFAEKSFWTAMGQQI